MKILVVEDNPIDYLIILHAFRDTAEIDWCHHPREAISRVKDKHDCMLVDYLLPDCLGNELVQHFRDQGIRTPVVMISGIDLSDKFSEWGAEAFFSKDRLVMNPEELVECVRRVVGP